MSNASSRDTAATPNLDASGAHSPDATGERLKIQASASIDDFFKESLDRACVDQRAEISLEAKTYVAGLLSDFVRPDTHGALGDTLERPLTLLLDEALQSPPSERFERLKNIGDGTLYVSGFFGDHLDARGVDDGLVATIGGFAYGSAASMLRAGSKPSHANDLFGELAGKFREIVQLIAAIAETTCFRARSNGDALKLYEKWLRTGNERIARELATLGLVGQTKAGSA